MSLLNWIEKLPEVGDPLLSDLRDVVEIERQINKLKAEKGRIERVLYADVRRLWTPSEIKDARARYKLDIG